MYSFYDTKAKNYGPLFFANTHGEAERTTETVANDTQTMIGQHPQDFDLVYFGKFDTNSGKMELTQSPEHMHKAIAFVKPSETKPVQLNSVQ